MSTLSCDISRIQQLQLQHDDELTSRAAGGKPAQGLLIETKQQINSLTQSILPRIERVLERELAGASAGEPGHNEKISTLSRYQDIVTQARKAI